MKADFRLGRHAMWVVLVTLVASVPARAQGVDDFFNGDVLHRVDLKMNSRDWNALRTHWEDNTYYPADLKWRGLTVRNVGIRSRGLGSRNGQKPGLRVDIDRYRSGQRFLGLKSFVLDNSWQDPSFLKERLTMRLFQRVGQPAPYEAYAQLYINNSYAGLYTIVESIDKDFLSRNFGQNDGVLFEFNFLFDWRFGWLGEDLQPYADLFSPKTHETDAPEDLYRPIETMVREMTEADSRHFDEVAARYLSLEDVFTFAAIQAALAQYDGLLGAFGMNNFYMYRFEDSQFNRFLVWDQDVGFSAVDHPLTFNLDQNEITRHAIENSYFRDYYFNRLLEVVNSMSEIAPDLPEGAEPKSWLESEIEKAYQLIRKSVASDPVKPTDMDGFESAVEELRVFARERPRFVRCEVAKVQLSSRDAEDVCRAQQESGQSRR